MNDKIEKEIVFLFIDDILPNRFQPRLTFDEKAMNELTDSVKQHGIIQPLVVRRLNDKYEIIAGERRYKAAQMAGLQKVPAIVMNLNDNESAEVAVIENIQRKDLSALEEAESYKKLLDKGYLTQEQLAARMGKNQSTISNKLRLLGLSSEVKEALLNGKISERHARSLLNLTKETDQKQILDKILSNKLTVRQTDELIKTIQNPSVEAKEDNMTLNTEDTPKSLVETLDFTENLSVPTEPIPYIDIPRIMENPDKSSEVSPSVQSQTLSEGINSVDIDELKENAEDINKVKEKADVNKLLGINPETEAIQKPDEQSIPKTKPRFIAFPDEETESDENNYSFPSNFENQFPQKDGAKTFTDSLIDEYRQTNGKLDEGKAIDATNINSGVSAIRNVVKDLSKAGFKVNMEDFDFEKIYQIIIKIEKN